MIASEKTVEQIVKEGRSGFLLCWNLIHQMIALEKEAEIMYDVEHSSYDVLLPLTDEYDFFGIMICYDNHQFYIQVFDQTKESNHIMHCYYIKESSPLVVGKTETLFKALKASYIQGKNIKVKL